MPERNQSRGPRKRCRTVSPLVRGCQPSQTRAPPSTLRIVVRSCVPRAGSKPAPDRGWKQGSGQRTADGVAPLPTAQRTDSVLEIKIRRSNFHTSWHTVQFWHDRRESVDQRSLYTVTSPASIGGTPSVEKSEWAQGPGGFGWATMTVLTSWARRNA